MSSMIKLKVYLDYKSVECQITPYGFPLDLRPRLTSDCHSLQFLSPPPSHDSLRFPTVLIKVHPLCPFWKVSELPFQSKVSSFP